MIGLAHRRADERDSAESLDHPHDVFGAAALERGNA
jgi:hypothetical protein